MGAHWRSRAASHSEAHSRRARARTRSGSHSSGSAHSLSPQALPLFQWDRRAHRRSYNRRGTVFHIAGAKSDDRRINTRARTPRAGGTCYDAFHWPRNHSFVVRTTVEVIGTLPSYAAVAVTSIAS